MGKSNSSQILVLTLTFTFVVLFGDLGLDAKAQTRRTPVRPRPTATPAPTQPKKVPRKPNVSDQEEMLWREAETASNENAYNFYLQAYPKGAYAVEAERALMGLREIRERVEWENALKQGTTYALVGYLAAGPRLFFVEEAINKIASLEREEDEAEWRRADDEKTSSAYLNYLGKFPWGLYSQVAILRLGTQGVEAPSRNVPKGQVGSIRTNTIGMQFSWIPSGSFMMGSLSTENSRSSSDGPQRLVTIRQGFWIGRHEVTQGQYDAVMGTNRSRFSNCGKDCPVEQVSWNDAKEFIKRLNDRNDGFVYSLPTEAEWEYAARAGTTTATAFGNSLDSTQANFNGNFPYGNATKGPYLEGTTKVGSYRPNAWGLYDMHGNVWEWIEDIWKIDYTGLPTDGSANTIRGDASQRVMRGGSWYNAGSLTRSAFRYLGSPADALKGNGFRVVARARNQSSVGQWESVGQWDRGEQARERRHPAGHERVSANQSQSQSFTEITNHIGRETACVACRFIFTTIDRFMDE